MCWTIFVRRPDTFVAQAPVTSSDKPCRISVRALRSSNGCPGRGHGGYCSAARPSKWSARAVGWCGAQSGQPALRERRRATLQPDEASAVADVGFGGAVGLKFLLDSVGPSGRVHGVEVSETMLSRAARRYRRDIATGRLSLHSGSMTQLPFPDGALDGAITVNTIYFVAELDRAFRELARVINGRGRLVIGLADPDVMAKLPFTEHGFHLRPVPDVIDTLRSTGLTVEHRQISGDANAPHLLIAHAVA